MTSSRFSRRPRVQPTPKVCHVPPCRPPPPTPTTTMIADITWQYPGPPPPPFLIDQRLEMPWYPANNSWHGHTAPATDHVEVWFHLTPATGYYYAYLMAFRHGVNIFSASSFEAYLTPGDPIDVTISEWIGLTPDHELTAHFRCNLYPPF